MASPLGVPTRVLGPSSPLINAARATPANTRTITPMSVMNIPALFTSMPPSLEYFFRDPVYMRHSRVCSAEGVLHGGTSQNSPSETVWKSGMGPESGPRKRSRGVVGAPIGRSLGGKKRDRDALGSFPNSFSTHSG